MSLTLSSLSSNLQTVPSVERRPSSPDIAATDAQRAQVPARAPDIDSSAADNDTDAGKDPYAQIDRLLASLRDLTLGGASLKSASTTSQANSAYAAFANG